MYGIDYCYYAAPNEKETNLYFINATLLYLVSALNFYTDLTTTVRQSDYEIKATVSQDFTGTWYFATKYIYTNFLAKHSWSWRKPLDQCWAVK